MNAATVAEQQGFRVHLSPLHGSRYRYQGGCRCRPCVEANYAYRKAWRAKRGAGQ